MIWCGEMGYCHGAKASSDSESHADRPVRKVDFGLFPFQLYHSLELIGGPLGWVG